MNFIQISSKERYKINSKKNVSDKYKEDRKKHKVNFTIFNKFYEKKEKNGKEKSSADINLGNFINYIRLKIEFYGACKWR